MTTSSTASLTSCVCSSHTREPVLCTCDTAMAGDAGALREGQEDRPGNEPPHPTKCKNSHSQYKVYRDTVTSLILRPMTQNPSPNFRAKPLAGGGEAGGRDAT